MLSKEAGMPFIIDKMKDFELIRAINGASIIENASFKPPTSLSQPNIVPRLLSCIYLVLERVIFMSNNKFPPFESHIVVP